MSSAHSARVPTESLTLRARASAGPALEPRLAPISVENGATSDVRDQATKQKTLLVVDDDPLNATLLEHFLTEAGYRVLVACGGRAALERTAVDAPDAILLDAVMPEMDGFAVMEELRRREQTRGIPIVMVTALDDHAARMRALNAGAAEFLCKPVDRAELLVRISNLLRGQAYVDEQIRFKDEFLSHVSHELRSPLTAIKQFTSILLRGDAGALTGEQATLQEIVLRNVRQLQAMIDDLLDVTRLESGKLTINPVPSDVGDAVRDAMHTVADAAATKDIRLTAEMAGDLPRVMADPVRLRQILVILLDNAIKFSGRGDVVTLRTCADLSGSLRIDVADRGCGMSPIVMSQIFTRMFQGPDALGDSRKGLGLGLHICHELVRRQHGSISVSSTPGSGSVLTVLLPRFSLEPLIASLVRAGSLGAPLAVLDVDVRVGAEQSTPVLADVWKPIARGVVVRCLMPTLDVLLDSRAETATNEHYYVAASANAHGASILADRITRELLGHPELGAHGIRVSVTVTHLPDSPDPEASSPAARITRVAALLTAAIVVRHNPSDTDHEYR